MATVIAPAVAFNDRTVTARYFGTGNASRLIWNLAGMDSDRALLMPVIYRKDWQMPGHYALSSAARTNICLYSQALDTVASWAQTTVSFGADGTAPDGTTTADLLQNDGGGGSRVQQVITGTSTSHCLSIYVKKHTNDTFTLLLRNVTTAATLADATLTFSTGLLSTTTGTVGVVSLANGWFRLWVAATGITVGNSLRPQVYAGSSGGVVGSKVYVWGAQLESGTSPTSYIPTTTPAASVTDYAVDANGKVTFAAAPVANADVAYLDPWFGTAIYKSFGTGDGTATQFSLPWKPVTPAIYIDGVLQTLTTNYTVTPGGAVTFVVAPGNGAVLTWTGNMGAQR